MTQHRSRKDEDDSFWGTLVALFIGGAIVYGLARPKIDALEQQVTNLNWKVRTLEGHIDSLQGFVQQQNMKLQNLERDFQDLGNKYDNLIAELQFVASQLSGDMRQSLDAIIERAKRRKAQRVPNYAN